MIAAETESVAGALPARGVTDSHGASSATVKVSVPPPVLVTDTFCAPGFAPPCVAVKRALAGVTASAGGGGGSTVNVTGIVRGEPPRPRRLTVTSVV